MPGNVETGAHLANGPLNCSSTWRSSSAAWLDPPVPIAGGTGWQSGFISETVHLETNAVPPPEAGKEEEEAWELEQLSSGAATVGLTAIGPPEEPHVLSAEEKRVMELGPWEGYKALRKAFRFDICRSHILPGELPPSGEPKMGGGGGGGIGGGEDELGEYREELMKVLRMQCRDREYGGNYWRVTMGGRFHYVFNQRVWLNWKEWNCEKTGGSEIKYVQLVHCEAFFPNGAHYPTGTRFRGPIAAIGQWGFPLSIGQFAAEYRPNVSWLGDGCFRIPVRVRVGSMKSRSNISVLSRSSQRKMNAPRSASNLKTE